MVILYFSVGLVFIKAFFYVRQWILKGSSVFGTLRTELEHLFASRSSIATLTQ